MERLMRVVRVFALSAFGFTATVSMAAAPTGKYLKIVERMQAIEAAHPKFVKIFSIGENDDGVMLFGVRVSATPAKVDAGRVGHLVVGTHHGNETAAPEFVMKFVESLVQKYEAGELYRTALLDTEWSVIPVLNVSGYNASNRQEKGYDPNRDYPGPCISGMGGKLKSIRLVMEFMKTRIFSGSLTVHGYLGALTYPWGVDVSNTHTMDHNLFDSATAKAAKENGYRYGTSTDIVYPCDGAFEDYAYWKHGMWSLLLELDSGSAGDIERTVTAMHTYFDNLEASPSVKNKFNTECQRSGRLDLGIE